MDKVKRKIVIMTLLSLAIPTIFTLQYSHKLSSNDRYTVKQNLRNLDEEIETIQSVGRDILNSLDINKKFDDQMEVITTDIPANIRDPFMFPEDLIKEQSRKYTETQKTKVPEKKAKPREPKLALNLTGIIFDKENPMAIINGEVYKVSDKIAEYTIRSISEQGVQLVSNKKTIFLETPIIE